MTKRIKAKSVYKIVGDAIQRMAAEERGWSRTIGDIVALLQENGNLDQRWVAIGKTDLQTGLMALTRAIAKPTSF